MIDRVEISIIEESQPFWLAFLNRQTDISTVPLEFVNVAMPNGQLAPNLQRQGIQAFRTIGSDVTLTRTASHLSSLYGYARPWRRGGWQPRPRRYPRSTQVEMSEHHCDLQSSSTATPQCSTLAACRARSCS